MNRRLFLETVTSTVAFAALSSSRQASALKSENHATRSAKIQDSLGSNTANVRIGNFHSFYPGGIAFLKDDAWGVVLGIGWPKTGKPGTAAPDNSIYQINFDYEGVPVTCEWGRVGTEAAAVRLTAPRAVQITMDIPARPWAFFNNILWQSGSHSLEALAVSAEGQTIRWQLQSNVPITSTFDKPVCEGKFSAQIEADKPLLIVAGFGGIQPREDIGPLLDAATRKYERSRARATGSWGDFAGAIADNINNSRLYSSLSRTVATLIGRDQWIVIDSDYLPYFTWDTSFNGLLASIENPEQARETIRILLSFQRPDGMMPQYGGWRHEGPLPYINIAFSNPPVTSLCVWKMHERWPDRNFLAEVYPMLLKWHDWWPKHSDGNGNGLLEWGALGSFEDARLACGWDDTPAFDGATKVGTQMNADAVDLNSLWSMDAEYLARMADELGKHEDATRLRAEHVAMNQRINDLLWNEELGVYCSRLWGEPGAPGKFLVRLTPMNFYPLICGAPDEARASRLLKTLTDPKKFWGEWLIPTLAYDDPEWVKQDYWKGHTWAPVNYLIWQGIRRYGTPEQKLQLAERSVRLFMTNWTERGTCNEAYMSSTGMGDRYPHYTWGALLCQIGLEYVYDATADGQPRHFEGQPNTPRIELRNMPSGGKLYRIVSDGVRTSVQQVDGPQ